MPRPKRDPLTTVGIVAAALRVLDAEGLERITLRRLATELGVQVPALYRHFAGKQDLIDELAQTIISAGLVGLREPAGPADWQDWLRQAARRFHQALLSHRDAARIVAGAGLGRAPVLAELTELTLQTLTCGGLDLATATRAATTVYTFTLGYAIEEQAEPDPAAVPADPGILVPRFPLTAAALRQRQEPGTDAYAACLELILVGLQVP